MREGDHCAARYVEGRAWITVRRGKDVADPRGIGPGEGGFGVGKEAAGRADSDADECAFAVKGRSAAVGNATEIAKELEIERALLYRWRKEFKQYEKIAFQVVAIPK